MATKTKNVWCVVYCGAPYGEGESGEVVSTHRTEEAAEKARQRLQSNPKYYGKNSRVEYRGTPKHEHAINPEHARRICQKLGVNASIENDDPCLVVEFEDGREILAIWGIDDPIAVNTSNESMMSM